MVQKNIAIAIIIIILFIILAIAGFGIYAMQNHVLFFSKKRAVDEESAEEG
jgi:thiol:disulfide interchange protein